MPAIYVEVWTSPPDRVIVASRSLIPDQDVVTACCQVESCNVTQEDIRIASVTRSSAGGKADGSVVHSGGKLEGVCPQCGVGFPADAKAPDNTAVLPYPPTRSCIVFARWLYCYRQS